MGIKAILESLEGLDEAIQGLYKEEGDKFVLDVEGIDNHPKVRGVVTANRENVKKRDTLKAKVDELEAKLSAVPEDFDPEEYATLKAKSADGGGEPGKAEKEIQSLKATYENQIAGLKRKIEEVTAAKDGEIAERDSYIDRTVKDGELKQALLDAGVDTKFLAATQALHSSKAKVVRDDNGDRRGVFETDLGEVSISQFIKDWAETDQGKPFIKPATGADPKGGSKGAAGNTIKRSQWDQMSHADRAKAARDGKKVVDG